MRPTDLWALMPPVPKGNAQKIVRYGKFVRVRPLDRILAAQHRLARLLRDAAGPTATITGPVWRDACYVLPIPPSWPKWKRRAARELRFLPPGGGRQPDIGNLTKLLDDAIEAAGLIANDGQIVGGTCCKLYGDSPGYLVRITELPQASRALGGVPFVRPPLVPPQAYRAYREAADAENDPAPAYL